MFRLSTTISLMALSLGIVFGLGSPTLGEEPRIDNSPIPIGEDFRVDNTVFAGDKKEPISRSVTIFHDGIVYDCMKTPAETVVFDKTTKRFVLLNMADDTRAELTTHEVTDFVARFEEPIEVDDRQEARRADPVHGRPEVSGTLRRVGRQVDAQQPSGHLRDHTRGRSKRGGGRAVSRVLRLVRPAERTVNAGRPCRRLRAWRSTRRLPSGRRSPRR